MKYYIIYYKTLLKYYLYLLYFIYLNHTNYKLSFNNTIDIGKRYLRIHEPMIFGLVTAGRLHKKVNQKYGNNLPYYAHLLMVYFVARDYIYLLKPKYRSYAILACFAHDLIEDARLTYNDIVKIFGIEVAEVVYCLTNEKGKTRKERANNMYYSGIKANYIAIFTKLCDRFANIKFSYSTKSTMFNKYKQEQYFFDKQLYIDNFSPMFRDIKNYLK